jgi:protein arginine kinase activator
MKLCESCGENPARILLTRIEGTDTSTKHICFSCAEKMGLEIPTRDQEKPYFDESDFEDGDDFYFEEAEIEDEAPPPERVCPKCGKKEQAFSGDMIAGCSACYEVFENIIADKTQHEKRSFFYHGKTYNYSRTRGCSTEIEYLRHELDRAVRKQKYELAAVLRDRIQQLQTGGSL